jgi:hypothetical protein
MDAFKRGGGIEGCVLGNIKKGCAFKQQKWPEALAAA